MNLNTADAHEDDGFAPETETSESGADEPAEPDRLDEKLNTILDKARESEAAAVERLRREQDELLGDIL